MSPKQSIRQAFPAPWRAEDTASGFRVVATNGRVVAYIYGEDEEVRRSILSQPTMAEAKAIASAIAMLPELMPK